MCLGQNSVCVCVGGGGGQTLEVGLASPSFCCLCHCIFCFGTMHIQKPTKRKITIQPSGLLTLALSTITMQPSIIPPLWEGVGVGD